MLDVDLAQAARMASLYPAAFLSLDGQFGRIEPGYRADLVLVDGGVNVIETWIAGQPSDSTALP
jgi:N-acetylglucosamine-6-phosphate deacetylase